MSTLTKESDLVYEVMRPDGTPLGSWALTDIIRLYSSGEWQGEYLARIPRVKGMSPLYKLVENLAEHSTGWVCVPRTHWGPLPAWWHSVCRMFDIKGRAGREEFFNALFGHFIVFLVWVIVILYVDYILNSYFAQYHFIAYSTIAASFFCSMGGSVVIPVTSLCVRRLHDTGRRGIWLPVLICSLVGIPLLILMLSRKSTQANRYGAMAMMPSADSALKTRRSVLYELHAGMFRMAGRCARKEYWSMIGIYSVTILLLFVLTGYIGTVSYENYPLVIQTFFFVVGYSTLLLLLHLPTLFCATVRRLHDSNHSAWWMLLLIFPPALLALLLFKSSPPNCFDEPDIYVLRKGDEKKKTPLPHWTLYRVLTSAFHRFDDWEGRAGRPEFFGYVTFCVLVGSVVAVGWFYLADVSNTYVQLAWNIGMVSVICLVLPPLVSMSIRRVHDAGCSAWWLPLVMLPGGFSLYAMPICPVFFTILSLLPSLLCLFCLPSESENLYGKETEWPL